MWLSGDALFSKLHKNGSLSRRSLTMKTEESSLRAGGRVGEAMFLYNTKRPHLALNYETPEKKHSEVA
jgi:transposase InsO family protein